MKCLNENSLTFAPCTTVCNMLLTFSMPKNWCVGNQHHAKHNRTRFRPYVVPTFDTK